MLKSSSSSSSDLTPEKWLENFQVAMKSEEKQDFLILYLVLLYHGLKSIVEQQSLVEQQSFAFLHIVLALARAIPIPTFEGIFQRPTIPLDSRKEQLFENIKNKKLNLKPWLNVFNTAFQLLSTEKISASVKRDFPALLEKIAAASNKKTSAQPSSSSSSKKTLMLSTLTVHATTVYANLLKLLSTAGYVDQIDFVTTFQEIDEDYCEALLTFLVENHKDSIIQTIYSKKPKQLLQVATTLAKEKIWYSNKEENVTFCNTLLNAIPQLYAYQDEYGVTLLHRFAAFNLIHLCTSSNLKYSVELAMSCEDRNQLTIFDVMLLSEEPATQLRSIVPFISIEQLEHLLTRKQHLHRFPGLKQDIKVDFTIYGKTTNEFYPKYWAAKASLDLVRFNGYLVYHLFGDNREQAQKYITAIIDDRHLFYQLFKYFANEKYSTDALNHFQMVLNVFASTCTRKERFETMQLSNILLAALPADTRPEKTGNYYQLYDKLEKIIIDVMHHHTIDFTNLVHYYHEFTQKILTDEWPSPTLKKIVESLPGIKASVVEKDYNFFELALDYFFNASEIERRENHPTFIRLLNAIESHQKSPENLQPLLGLLLPKGSEGMFAQIAQGLLVQDPDIIIAHYQAFIEKMKEEEKEEEEKEEQTLSPNSDVIHTLPIEKLVAHQQQLTGSALGFYGDALILKLYSRIKEIAKGKHLDFRKIDNLLMRFFNLKDLEQKESPTLTRENTPNLAQKLLHGVYEGQKIRDGSYEHTPYLSLILENLPPESSIEKWDEPKQFKALSTSFVDGLVFIVSNNYSDDFIKAFVKHNTQENVFSILFHRFYQKIENFDTIINRLMAIFPTEIDKRNSNHVTPLHLFMTSGPFAASKISDWIIPFIETSATIRDKNGLTPFDLALLSLSYHSIDLAQIELSSYRSFSEKIHCLFNAMPSSQLKEVLDNTSHLAKIPIWRNNMFDNNPSVFKAQRKAYSLYQCPLTTRFSENSLEYNKTQTPKSTLEIAPDDSAIRYNLTRISKTHLLFEPIFDYFKQDKCDRKYLQHFKQVISIIRNHKTKPSSQEDFYMQLKDKSLALSTPYFSNVYFDFFKELQNEYCINPCSNYKFDSAEIIVKRFEEFMRRCADATHCSTLQEIASVAPVITPAHKPGQGALQSTTTQEEILDPRQDAEQPSFGGL